MSLIPQDWSARERHRARRVLQRRDPEQVIDTDLCAAIRQRAVDGATSADLRREIDAAAQTIRRHLRGLCDCDHDVAPVVWDATTQEWVREELPDGDDELVTDGGRDLVRACPACDSPDVRVRPGGYNSGPGRLDGRRWRCKDCGATFDEPVERASKRSHAGLSGTARDLAEADPDDLRADGGRERVWIANGRQRGHGSPSVIHTDRDCYRLGLSPEIVATTRDELAASIDWSDCPACVGEEGERRSGLARQLAEADPDDLRADGGAYPCALCDTKHSSLEAALQCCGEKLQVPAEFADDLWTCDRCGEFATERCRDDAGDYCLWCRERVDAQRREADADREVRPDGGQRDDQQIVDALERQADALERLADEQRYQSAALTEIVRSLDEVAAAADEREPDRYQNVRSFRAIQTDLESNDHERREAVDESYRRKLPDGGVETQAVLVDGPVPDECTTELCHGAPEWAVRHGDGVSRQVGDSATPGGPPDGAVAPYVCDDCRRERYPTIDADDWVRVAASDGGRSMHPTIVPCGNCRDPTPVGELVDGPDGRAVCPPCGRGEGHREHVRTDGGTTVPDPDGGAFDHPVRQGAIVRRLHESEGTEVLLEVLGRFKHLDDGHIEYRLTCPTRTGYYRYRGEDLDDCFVDTGLTNDESRKAIGDSEIRALYQHLHDEHDEHSFTEVIDPDSGETWQQCLHCGQDESDSLVTDGGHEIDRRDPSCCVGDVVVDLASGASMQLVAVRDEPAVAHERVWSDDTNQLYDPDRDEPVYGCVFLPDGDRISPPSTVYDYPESRLLRYPVERADGGPVIQARILGEDGGRA